MRSIFDKVHDYYGRPYNMPLLDNLKITDYLEKWNKYSPNQEFIVNISPDGDEETITYRECYQLVHKVCLELQKTYQINLFDKVALIPKNSINSVIIILALIKLDITVVMINASEPENKIKDQLETVKCEVIISDAGHVKDLVVLEAEKIISDSKNQPTIVDKSKKILDIYSPSILLFTTGTTSSSKAVAQSNYNIVNNCYALLKHHKLDNHSRLMCVLPIYYANGLEFTIFTTFNGWIYCNFM